MNHEASVLVLGDDEPLVTRIAALARPAFPNIQTALSDDAALALSRERAPQLLLFLMAPGGANAESRLAHLHAELPGVPAVALADRSVLALVGLLRRLMREGLRGLVLLEEMQSALVPAAELVLLGQLSMPSELRESLARPALSHREKEILMLVADGCTNSQIAQRLYLSESTVKSHLTSSFRKLAVTTRAQAAQRAREQAN